jgi:hypothetical protein
MPFSRDGLEQTFFNFFSGCPGSNHGKPFPLGGCCRSLHCIASAPFQPGRHGRSIACVHHFNRKNVHSRHRKQDYIQKSTYSSRSTAAPDTRARRNSSQRPAANFFSPRFRFSDPKPKPNPGCVAIPHIQSYPPIQSISPPFMYMYHIGRIPPPPPHPAPLGSRHLPATHQSNRTCPAAVCGCGCGLRLGL